MASDGSVLYGVTPKRLEELIGDAVTSSIPPQHGIVSHRKVRYFFDYEIGAERIVNYIKGYRLPAHIEVPLPAYPVGQTYFVEISALEKWLAGRSTWNDCYEWQREKHEVTV